jgi:hypothetical protein
MNRSALTLVIWLATACGGDTASAPTAAKVAVSARLASGPIADAVGATVSIDIVALDAEQKSVAGQVVNFVVTSGGGSIFAPAVTTDGTGHARNSWTLGTVAGTQVVELRTISPTGSAVVLGTASADVKPGVPETFSLSASSASDPAAAWIVGRARDAMELLAGTVRDRYGNAVTGYQSSVTQQGTWTNVRTIFTASRAWETNRLTVTIGTKSTNVDAWAVEDWRATKWTVRYACTAKASGLLTRYALTVDSVRYRSESTLWPGPQALGVFFASGTATPTGGAPASVRRELLLWRAWADSLQLGVPSGAANGDGRLYVGQTPPPSYSLKTWTFVRTAPGSNDFGSGQSSASWCMPSESVELNVGAAGTTFVMTKGN